MTERTTKILSPQELDALFNDELIADNPWYLLVEVPEQRQVLLELGQKLGDSLRDGLIGNLADALPEGSFLTKTGFMQLVSVVPATCSQREIQETMKVLTHSYGEKIADSGGPTYIPVTWALIPTTGQKSFKTLLGEVERNLTRAT